MCEYCLNFLLALNNRVYAMCTTSGIACLDMRETVSSIQLGGDAKCHPVLFGGDEVDQLGARDAEAVDRIFLHRIIRSPF